MRRPSRCRATVDDTSPGIVTGGGLPENLPRVIPEGLGIAIDVDSWQPDPLFSLIQQSGRVADAEMRRTFNMGVGFAMVVETE